MLFGKCIKGWLPNYQIRFYNCNSHGTDSMAMIQRAYSLLIIVLLLVQSSFGQRKNYTVSFQKCNKELFESFREEQSSKEYHFTVEESLSDVGILNVQKQLIDYHGEYDNWITAVNNYSYCDCMHAVVLASDDGMKPITGFAILVDSNGSCQQPAGWFDQLDSVECHTMCAYTGVVHAIMIKVC